MFQKFFTNTLESQFIKNLVGTFPTPIIPTVNNHDYIIQTVKYIYGDRVIECLKSGYIEDNPWNTDGKPIAEYRIIQNYIVGEYYPQFTEKFISNTAFYDSDTHYHLGQLLRCLRDTTNVDLMPYYNCFNYKVLGGSIQKVKNDYFFSNSVMPQYKLFATPIKFNKTYTIALDAYADVYMAPVLYSEQGELKDTSGNPFLKVKAKKFRKLDFLHPITYKIDPKENIQNMESIEHSYEEFLGHYEKYLYLVIQLPVNTDTSIVVLEGDYTHTSSSKIISAECTDVVELNRALVANPSLLLWNDGNIYAYSDRLIEYLLLNVVCSSLQEL